MSLWLFSFGLFALASVLVPVSEWRYRNRPALARVRGTRIPFPAETVWIRLCIGIVLVSLAMAADSGWQGFNFYHVEDWV